MFSIDELDKIKQLLEQLSPLKESKYDKDGLGSKKNHGEKSSRKDQKKQQQDRCPEQSKNKERCIQLTPSQLLVIAGFIGGVLEVNSVLVNRDQAVEILLTGSLKRKTQLDKVMEQIGKMPFDQVMKSIMDNADD